MIRSQEEQVQKERKGQLRLPQVSLRVPRLSLALIAIGVLVLLHLIIGLVYVKQVLDQRATSRRIETMGVLLQQRGPDLAALEARLAQVRGELAGQDDLIPLAGPADEAFQPVAQAALERGVAFVAIHAGQERQEEVRQSIYQVISFTTTAVGSREQLLSFLGSLEEDAFDALVIDRAELTKKEEVWKLNLAFSIYGGTLEKGSASGEAGK